MKLPQAKFENIVVQQLRDETLIYDLIINKAYCLNETAAKVFNACDGQTSFEEFKRRHQFTDDLIYLTLNELKTNNLIENYQIQHFAEMNRRELVRKIGLASLIALPVISSLVAPTAATASSATTCTPGFDNSDFMNGVNGQGDFCLCNTNVGAGNTCGRGTVGAMGCKQNCVCTATICNASTCDGTCG